MTKKEFLKFIDKEKPDTNKHGFVIDGIEVIKGGPAMDGCKYEKGKWKLYSPSERGGITVYYETESEDEAFDHLYEYLQAIVYIHKKDTARKK